MELSHASKLVLSVVEFVSEIVAFLGLLPGHRSHLFFLHTLTVELILSLFSFTFSNSDFVSHAIKLITGIVEGTLQLGYCLLIFLNLELVVLVLVDKGVQLKFLVFQGGNVLISILNQVIQSIDLLGHKCDFVFVFIELKLNVSELIDVGLKFAEFNTTVIDFLFLPPEEIV